MTTSDLVDRHLRHAGLRTDWVVMHDTLRDEQYYRSDIKTLRTHTYCSEYRIEADHGRHANQQAFDTIVDLPAVSHGQIHADGEYAPYWRWLAAAAMAVTAIGLIIGVAAPGPLTGAVFPIGITALLVVAYRARPRHVTSSDMS